MSPLYYVVKGKKGRYKCTQGRCFYESPRVDLCLEHYYYRHEQCKYWCPYCINKSYLTRYQFGLHLKKQHHKVCSLKHRIVGKKSQTFLIFLCHDDFFL